VLSLSSLPTSRYRSERAKDEGREDRRKDEGRGSCPALERPDLTHSAASLGGFSLQRTPITNHLWAIRNKPTHENAEHTSAVKTKVEGGKRGEGGHGVCVAVCVCVVCVCVCVGEADAWWWEQTMADSYTEALLPFSTDAPLREDYLTYAGKRCLGVARCRSLTS
jgi:hypothetical protein